MCSGVDTDELWTARSLVDNKEAVVRVTRDWVAAGARIVLTASYQVSAELFAEQLGLTRQQTWEHVVDSVSLAVRAVREEGGVVGHTLIGGSVGPYGACLHDGSEYSGHYLQGDNAVTHQRLVEWHRDRIQALQVLSQSTLQQCSRYCLGGGCQFSCSGNHTHEL